MSGPASKTPRKARRITKGLSALLYGRQAVDIWCMPQTRALNDVRRELEGLEYARLTDSTPARDARHKELCLREVQLLGRQGVTCTENCVGASFVAVIPSGRKAIPLPSVVLRGADPK